MTELLLTFIGSDDTVTRIRHVEGRAEFKKDPATDAGRANEDRMMKTSTVGTENEVISSVCNAFIVAGYSIRFRHGTWTQDGSDAMRQYLVAMADDGQIVPVFVSKDNGKSVAVVEFVPGNGRDVIHNWSPSVDAIVESVLSVIGL